jgi:flagellin-like hook-associated protein FlgL
MIAGLSSSLALAQRTAAQARVTMDAMSRQIATGQKVASVKDDGAAWARAAGMRSEAVQWDVRTTTLGRIETGLETTRLWIGQTLEAFDRLNELVLSARATVAGGASRAAIAAEWAQVVEWTRSFDGMNDNPAFTVTGFVAGTPGGYTFNGADSFYGPEIYNAYPHGGGFDSWMDFVGGVVAVTMRNADILNATSAQLDDVRTKIEQMRTSGAMWMRNVGADLNGVERLKQRAAQGADQVAAQIGSLTDADLGRASTARADADARSRLALQVVREALDAYGAFAGGLLANAQRSQRSVLA